jgi:hypothetical protein
MLLAALEAITMSVAVVEADCADTAATRAEAARALNCILLDYFCNWNSSALELNVRSNERPLNIVD